MLSTAELALRLAVAAGLGSAIGLERERLERAAGLRTHALVAVTAALIMVVSAYGFDDALKSDGREVLDPSRVAAQVVSGIGFLGAGVIIFRKNAVRGLTTAASVWSVAGIGLACGGGLIAAAAVATAIILVIQAGLRPIERHFFQHHRVHQLTVRVRREPGRLALVESALASADCEIKTLRLRSVRGGAEDRIEVELGSGTSTGAARMVDALRAIEGVRAVEYTYTETPGRGATSTDDADSSDSED